MQKIPDHPHPPPILVNAATLDGVEHDLDGFQCGV
jgi:hypothetical protein